MEDVTYTKARISDRRERGQKKKKKGNRRKGGEGEGIMGKASENANIQDLRGKGS